MPRFGIKLKSRRKTGIGGFHAEYLNDRDTLQSRKKTGLSRSIFSSLSLLFGGCMIYVSLHYIPAFIQPKQVLQFVSGDSAALNTYDFDRNSKFHNWFDPYLKLFHLDRTYMKSGQQVDVKYDLPEGASAKLEIVQCRQAWIIEIFKCDVIGQFNSTTKRRSGVQSFALNQNGFYHFKQEVMDVPEGEPYRILWERGL